MYVLIIIAVCLAYYLRTFHYKCVIDDIDTEKRSKENPLPRGWRWWWEHFYGDYIEAPRVSHLFSTLFHTVNCVLMYYAAGQGNVGLVASLLFCLHPANSQGAVWLSGKHYSIATTLALLSLVLPKYCAPGLYLAGLHVGVNILMLPVVFLMKGNYWTALAMVLMHLVITKEKKSVQATVAGRYGSTNNRLRSFTPNKLIIMVKTFSYYVAYSLLPYKVGMYHTFGYSYGITKQDSDELEKLDAHFWLGCLLIVLYAMLWWMHRGDMAWFGLMWYAVNISIWCNAITIQQFLSCRYTYLANAGMCIALSYLLVKGGV